MPLVTDIAAIIARVDLTLDQKRAQIYSLKANAIVTALSTQVNVPFTATGGYSITITQAPVYDSSKKQLIFSKVTATRNSQPIPLALPLIYVNPPIMQGGSESPLEAAKQMVVDTVRRFG